MRTEIGLEVSWPVAKIDRHERRIQELLEFATFSGSYKAGSLIESYQHDPIARLNAGTPVKNSQTDARSVFIEFFLRFFAIFIYSVAVYNLTRALWADPTRWTLLALLVTEGYAMVLIVCARRSVLRDASAVAVVATLYSVFYYVLFDPGRTTSLIPEYAGVTFYIVGNACQFYAKTALGRSFGLLPAQRGLIERGPYRFVRHPMYLGYLIGQTGFMLVNFSWWNLVVLFGIYLALWLRISREESVLEQSDDYNDYRKRVPWRIFPFLY